jgi:hypothetical protein
MRQIWRVTSAWTKLARLNAPGDRQYKEYADEFRGLAATAKKPEQKKQLLEMATAWDAVARQKKCELAKRDLGETSVAARQAR